MDVVRIKRLREYESSRCRILAGFLLPLCAYTINEQHGVEKGKKKKREERTDEGRGRKDDEEGERVR